MNHIEITINTETSAAQLESIKKTYFLHISKEYKEEQGIETYDDITISHMEYVENNMLKSWDTNRVKKESGESAHSIL